MRCNPSRWIPSGGRTTLSRLIRVTYLERPRLGAAFFIGDGYSLRGLERECVRGCLPHSGVAERKREARAALPSLPLVHGVRTEDLAGLSRDDVGDRIIQLGEV